jgi:hypothetical protein
MFFSHFVGGASLSPTRFAEARNYRRDFLAVPRISVDMLFDINQSGKLGTHFFIRFSDLFGQCVGLLSVFLLNGLDELLTQIADLAIGLGLSLIATDDAYDVSCVRFQLGNIRLLTLRIERRCRKHQSRNDQ